MILHQTAFHWHPMLVHLPIAFALFLPIFTALYILWKQSLTNPKQFWLLVILLQFLMVGLTYTAMATGENDEEIVEEIYGIGKFIEAHEDAAQMVLVASILSLIGAGATIRFRGAAYFTLAMQLVTLGLVVYTGRLGGDLVYVHGAAEAHTKTGHPNKEKSSVENPNDAPVIQHDPAKHED